MIKAKEFILIALAGIILQPKILTAQIPRQINYQGYLTNTSGQAITDTLRICFSIYSDQNRKKLLWSEEQEVIIQRGIYNVILGLKNPINDTTFSGGIRYLGLRIGNNPNELDPLTPILSVGYAFTANKARYADSTRLLVSFADSAYKASIADSARQIGRSSYADSARRSVLADTASLAKVSNKTIFTEKAGFAEKAQKSSSADTAFWAVKADSANFIRKVGHADSSTIALKADTALIAIQADSAFFAENALRSETSKKAIFADTARRVIKADSADYVKNANHADSAAIALKANIATISIRADSSKFAESVRFSDNSKKAIKADSATWAAKADSAKFVLMVNYADSSESSYHANVSDSSKIANSAAKALFALEAGTAVTADSAKFVSSVEYATKAGSATIADQAINSDMLDNRHASEFSDRVHIHDERYYTIVQSKSSDSNSIDAKRVGGKEVGNQNGNIPINNGRKNLNLNSDMIDSLHAGNKINQIAINNGILNQMLNADLLDGLDASAFVDSQFKTYLKSPGSLSDPTNPVHWTKLRDVPTPLAKITLDGFSGGGIEGSLSIRKSPMNFISKNQADSNGISIESNPMVGIRVKQAIEDGISIDSATHHAINITSSDYGINIQSVKSYGIYVASAISDAIRINSTGETGCGIYVNQAGNNGITINSAKQYGIRACGDNGGARFEVGANSNAYALSATAKSSNGKALFVQGASKLTSWATSDSGFVSKSCNDLTLYAVNCLDFEIIASGQARLSNGNAYVRFESSFSNSISSDFPIKVVVTGSEMAAGLLYVTNKTINGFEVNLQEIPGLNNYTKNLSFDWLAIGRKKGFENRRNVIIKD